MSSLPQALHEEARTIQNVPAVRVTRPALASTQMAVEHQQQLLSQVRNEPSALSRPVKQVLRGAEVLPSGTRGIAGFEEGASEPFEQGAPWVLVQCPKSSPASIEVR
jgi:hypothetical protein